MIVAALLITKCNGRFVQNKRCQETGKEYFTIVEMNVKEQYLMPDYAKPSPPSAPQTHTYQQKGHCLPNDLCPSHTAFFRFPSQINVFFFTNKCFLTFLDSRDRLDRRTAYVEDLMDLLPFVYLIIFSLSRFSLFFSEDDTIF